MDSHVPSDDLSGFWTNEKHVNFLNRMEASFVRTMLENGDRSMLKCANAPLNRYVPDSSESTRELGHRRNRRKNIHLYFPEVTDPNTNAVRSNGRKTRKRSTRRHDVSQDQVVPQIGYSKGDENDE